jgi:tetratricopeptide (TPR) repeat protein
LNNLAAVEYAEKNYRSAILTYLKALAISPSDPVVYSNLGTAYFAYDRFDYAVSSYRYALLLDPAIFERTGRSGSIVHQRDIHDIAAFNFYMAKTYASLNNLEDTLLYLVKAWEEGFPDFRKALDDPVFAFLAQDPRFLELIARLDAEQQLANPSQPASAPR